MLFHLQGYRTIQTWWLCEPAREFAAMHVRDELQSKANEGRLARSARWRRLRSIESRQFA